MVRVYDLGFTECSKVVVFHGEREVSLEQTQQFSGIHRAKQQQVGKAQFIQNQGFLLPECEFEFNITTTIEEISSLTAIEGCSVHTSSRFMVLTSGPATLGPGIVVDSDLSNPIRTHRDLINGHAPHYIKSCGYYNRLSHRLSDTSIVPVLFACSLDQVGAGELKVPVERSGGFMLLGELFDLYQFR